MSRPEVRARHIQAVLKGIGSLPEPSRSSVLSRVDGSVVASLQGATGLEWLPVDMNVALVHAVHQELGSSEFKRFYRALFVEVFRGSTFRPFTKGTRSVFGLDPAGWMRWLPEMWTVSYRNCGTWTTGAGWPGRVGMVLSGVPPACVVDHVWPTAVGAALGAVLDIGGLEGDVEVQDVDAGIGLVRFQMRWRSTDTR